jgi:hypothetical protein
VFDCNTNQGATTVRREPLPCAFCGGRAVITLRSGGYRVECVDRFDGCPMNARTHHCATEQEAIGLWNQRAAVPTEVDES